MGSNIIPTDPSHLIAFDHKLRECCKQTDLNSGLVDAELADQVCAILIKDSWTDTERRKLKAMLDSLYT